MNHFTGMAMANDRQTELRRRAVAARQGREAGGSPRGWSGLVGRIRIPSARWPEAARELLFGAGGLNRASRP
jgi:hypothetical protein